MWRTFLPFVLTTLCIGGCGREDMAPRVLVVHDEQQTLAEPQQVVHEVEEDLLVRPIKAEEVLQWKQRADLVLELAVQVGRVQGLEDLMEQLEGNESTFFDRVARKTTRLGESISEQLTLYCRVRQRIAEELAKARRKQATLQAAVEQMDPKELLTMSIRLPGGTGPRATLKERRMNVTERSLAEIGVSADGIEKLAERGIYTSRDFALEFCLPEQHPLLADLLGIQTNQATELVRLAVELIPPEELDQLVDEARRVQQYPPGALPPDHQKPGT